MKKKIDIPKVVDSIVAIMQTMIMALISFLGNDNPSYRIIAYFIVTTCFIVYYLFLRNPLIEFILSYQKIDVDYIKQMDIASVFKQSIVPEIRSISDQTVARDDFELLYRFMIWKKSVYFVADHFWEDNQLCNVMMKDSISYAINTVYQNEIIAVSRKLLELRETNDFVRIISAYSCVTLQKEIDEKISILKKITQR